ncbi:MAG TPA: glycerophosphodiester phosphodiesterase [Propionibacteriaceae bacterium]|nr:glycerophosphodiester phosphodiesterase [Propionibacteriaceae bacterium]
MSPQVWGHRGASDRAPENTLPAFELAVRAGADGIELDVQRSADGALVVCHDETVERTSDGEGAIVDLTLDELRSLDFSNGMEAFAGTRIPLLAEVFELMRPTGLLVNVELKDSEEPYPGMAAQALALAADMGVSDRVIWSSFNHHTLLAIRDADPAAPTGVLVVEPLVDIWAYARRLGASAVHPYHRALRLMPDAVERCHAAGVRVNTWTVNSPADLADMAKLGVDVVISNVPDLGRR